MFPGWTEDDTIKWHIMFSFLTCGMTTWSINYETSLLAKSSKLRLTGMRMIDAGKLSNSLRRSKNSRRESSIKRFIYVQIKPLSVIRDSKVKN
jgi:hypothetical protein